MRLSFVWSTLFMLALPGTPALARGAVDYCGGTKPIVCSLRANEYGRRKPSPAPRLTLRDEIAGSKPVLWSLRGGKETPAPTMPEHPSPPPYRCWGTKPVVWSLQRGRC